jgi:hypothetical protein
MEAYENSRHELELLRIPARGEKEIEAGKRYESEEALKVLFTH